MAWLEKLSGQRTHGMVTDLLRLISTGQATTRAQLAHATGLSRSTVSQRVNALIASQLVYELGEGLSTGGRPPLVLAFNKDAGVVLAADLGATHSRLAVCDLGGTPLTELTDDLLIAQGPGAVLTWVADRFDDLLARSGRDASEVRAIGVGVPGPVDFDSGRPAHPPIMPGWHGVSIPERLAQRFEVPVLVDNDVNMMALGEHRSARPRHEFLLFVKVGTGIGCGIVSNGRVHHGADGAAGDIGHVRLSGYDDVVCRCGNTACLEAVAGGAALAERARAAGRNVATTRDLTRLALDGDPFVVQLVRAGGRHIGEVLASLVSFHNPSAIVIGGDLADAGEQVLAGIREVIYRRSLPLATSRLQIVRSELGDRAGVIGAGALAAEAALAAGTVEAALRVAKGGGR